MHAHVVTGLVDQGTPASRENLGIALFHVACDGILEMAVLPMILEAELKFEQCEAGESADQSYDDVAADDEADDEAFGAGGRASEYGQ